MRNREIGVLRALGASKKDVFLVCFFESLIIGAVIFIMALIESLVACHFINDYYMPLFMSGITSLSILFAICFGMVMLATAIPLAKVVKRSPVEIINNSMSVF